MDSRACKQRFGNCSSWRWKRTGIATNDAEFAVTPMHASDIAHWVVAILFGLFGWWLIILNFTIAYVWLVRRKFHSWIPLAGGLFALAGMALCPVPQIRRLAWVPLVIDIGFFISALTIGFLMQLYAR